MGWSNVTCDLKVHHQIEEDIMEHLRKLVPPIGVILANLALIVTSALVSEEFFNTWGWRIF